MKKTSLTKTKPPREHNKLRRLLWRITTCFTLVSFKISAQNKQETGIVNANDFDGPLLEQPHCLGTQELVAKLKQLLNTPLLSHVNKTR